MASTFDIHARQHWTFQLVLFGGQAQLEGWCHPSEQEDSLHCSAWLHPLEDPQTVAQGLIDHPRCARPGEAVPF